MYVRIHHIKIIVIIIKQEIQSFCAFLNRVLLVVFFVQPNVFIQRNMLYKFVIYKFPKFLEGSIKKNINIHNVIY